MSSDSMEEDDPFISMLFDSEDYMETCEDEVDDMVPRLEKLSINEESMNSSCDMNVPDVSNEIIYLDETMTSDSNERCFISVVDISNSNLLNEDTKVAVVGNKSSFRDDGIPQIVSAIVQPQLRAGDDIQKASAFGEFQIYPSNPGKEIILNKPEKTKDFGVVNALVEKPLDLSLKLNTDSNNEVEFSSTLYENKTQNLILNAELAEGKYVDPETGEVLEASGNISSNTLGSDGIGNTLDEISNDIIFDFDSSKLSYSADISSNDQSLNSSGIVLDTPPDTSGIGAKHVASVEGKKETFDFFLPLSKMSRQLCVSIFASSNTTDATRSLKTNSSDDEHSKKSSAIGKDSPMNVAGSLKTNSSDDEHSKKSSDNGKGSPMNSRRKCRKAVRSSPRLIARNPSFVKNGEEKRPSPCKRKKTSSENSIDSAGKVRRRSVSESNCKTAEKTHVAIRSRSLSAKSKNSQSASITDPSTEISTSPHTRKRTISESQNESRVKSRRSSDSSDEAGSQ